VEGSRLEGITAQKPTFTPVGTPQICDFFQSAWNILRICEITKRMSQTTNIDLFSSFRGVVVVKLILGG
jgi:hypothetical protein